MTPPSRFFRERLRQTRTRSVIMEACCLWVDDPATNRWAPMSSLPAARFSGVADVIGGALYFTGGSSQTTTWKGTVF